MACCLVEMLKSHSPRCEWNSDSTSCDCGRNLRAKLAVTHNPLLEQSLLILTSELLSSEALGVVFRQCLKNAGHAGARCVLCWRSECMW